MSIRQIGLSLLVAACLHGQEFDAATVTPTQLTRRHSNWAPSDGMPPAWGYWVTPPGVAGRIVDYYKNGRFVVHGYVLRWYLAEALGVKWTQVEANWPKVDGWDVSATAGTQTDTEVSRVMLRHLLVSEFGLEIKEVIKDMPACVATAPGGVTLKNSADPNAPYFVTGKFNGDLFAKAVTIRSARQSDLISFIDGMWMCRDYPVVWDLSLPARAKYDIDFSYVDAEQAQSFEREPAVSGPSFAQAFLRQTGIKISVQRHAVKVWNVRIGKLPQ